MPSAPRTTAEPIKTFAARRAPVPPRRRRRPARLVQQARSVGDHSRALERGGLRGRALEQRLGIAPFRERPPGFVEGAQLPGSSATGACIPASYLASGGVPRGCGARRKIALASALQGGADAQLPCLWIHAQRVLPRPRSADCGGSTDPQLPLP